MMAFCLKHPKWDQNPKFTPLSETTSIPTHFIGGVPPSPGPIVSTRFLFFVFYRDTQREPLRRREAAGFETGRRISFGSLQLENTAEIQATRAIAQALSEHVETFLSSTVEKCFALAKKLDQILQHCKSIWTRNLFIKKKLYKSCINTDFCKHQRIHYCKGAINLALSIKSFWQIFLGIVVPRI